MSGEIRVKTVEVRPYLLASAVFTRLLPHDGGDQVKESKVGGGRVAVYAPGHPGANNRGYVLRARIVMEAHLGRLLRPDEHVHHKNEDPQDDRIENLEIKTPAEHINHHRPHPGRKLDYDEIARLVGLGYGYKRIARLTGYPVYSVKYAVRQVRS